MRKLVVYTVARNQGLPEDTPRDHEKVYRGDVCDIRNNTARFIAASRQLVDDLMAEVIALREKAAMLEGDYQDLRNDVLREV